MNQGEHIELFEPDGMYRAATYAHAARAGNTVYVAGQVARDERGELVAAHDAAGQARVVFDNLERVLAAAGATLRDVVKITTYLVDRDDSKAVSEERLRRFGEHRPPHTGLIIAGLGGPEVRVEVEVVAVLPGP